MDANVSSCFGDTAWTVADPKLRTELAKRVRGRVRWDSPDKSDVVQEALSAALRNRLLLKELTPVQRSGWFWVVVTRLAARFGRRRMKAIRLLATGKEEGLSGIADRRAEEPPAALERSERIDMVRAAIGRLPESWRRVLTARIAFGDDWAAIATACESTESAARGLWYRAMGALRTELKATALLDATED
jgi:DNA-directed RNA polymerase specialized sigma24 family protein